MLEIVRDELLNKYSEMLYEHKRKIDGEIKEICSKTGRDFDILLTDEDIIQMTNQYAKYLEEQFEKLGATIIEYPSVPHKKVVERALQRKKPFNFDGQKGYRDALIWESILELVAREPAKVALISQNPRDFAEKNDILHSELQDEISALNNDAMSVTYYPDLESFVSSEITPRLEMLEDLPDQLIGDGYEGFDLPTFTSNKLYKFIDTQEIDPANVGLPHSFEALQIGAIEEVDKISNVAAYVLSDTDLLVAYESLVSASFTFLIGDLEYLGLPNDLLEKIEVWESDWNDYYRLCHMALDEIVLFNLPNWLTFHWIVGFGGLSLSYPILCTFKISLLKKVIRETSRTIAELLRYG